MGPVYKTDNNEDAAEQYSGYWSKYWKEPHKEAEGLSYSYVDDKIREIKVNVDVPEEYLNLWYHPVRFGAKPKMNISNLSGEQCVLDIKTDAQEFGGLVILPNANLDIELREI